MIEYYPWSEEVLSDCISGHDEGKLTTLDFEFTAKCTGASCIYCDSKPEVGERHPHELNNRETKKLIERAKDLGLKWIYACGLGEPLEDPRFKNMVEAANELDIRTSIFTNGIFIDEKKAKWLYDNRVCLIVKLDTLNESTFDKILGKKGAARKIYETMEILLDVGYGKNCRKGYTDLAISIVPTKLNINDIPEVVEFAKKNNIFPSIGELEQAGRVLEEGVHTNLALNENEILSLKKKVEKILWKGYTRPICPTIVTGLHVDNIGRYVVDLETGLNCKWFLLTEPLIKVIGDLREDGLEDVFERVKKYRRSCFDNDKIINDCESTEYVFGGCGGSPQKIIQLARQHL